MNILITGASGLIGTALVERLRGNGDYIICQSRKPQISEPDTQWVVHNLVSDSWENLELPEIDVVYHLAGQTSTYFARNEPTVDLSVNVLGLLNLMEYFRKRKSKPFIVMTGTATVAGLPECLPINESTPDRPITFYDISKLVAEMYLKQYIREAWVRGCVLRLANVFGRSLSGQQADRGIIDKVFRRAVSGQRITVYGDGNYLRDYIFIDDVVSALIQAARCSEATNGHSYYIGSGQGLTLKGAFMKVISLAATVTGAPVDYEHVPMPEDLSDIEKRNAIMDTSAFEQATGWRPQYDFDSGLNAAYLSSGLG